MAKRSTTRYKVRLEDPNSDEFRIVYLSAASEDEARALCEEKERQITAFSLAKDELTAEKAASKERGRPTGPLVCHEQAEDYAVVSVEARG